LDAKDKKNLKSGILLSCSLLACLWLGAASIISLRGAQKLNDEGKIAPAIVVSKISYTRGPASTGEIRYRYSVNNQTYERAYPVGPVDLQRLREGDRIEILYLESDPKTSAYQPAFEIAQQKTGLVAIGIVTVLLCFLGAGFYQSLASTRSGTGT